MAEISKNNPEVKNIPENLGWGSMICAPLSTAQGLWYSIGQWLFLHEQVCPDIFGNLDDVNWAHSKYDMLKNPPPPPPEGAMPPRKDQKLQDPGPLHCDWSPIQTIQDTVPWPVPYVTMDNNNTYTPFIGKDHL